MLNSEILAREEKQVTCQDKTLIQSFWKTTEKFPAISDGSVLSLRVLSEKSDRY